MGAFKHLADNILHGSMSRKTGSAWPVLVRQKEARAWRNSVSWGRGIMGMEGGGSQGEPKGNDSLGVQEAFRGTEELAMRGSSHSQSGFLWKLAENNNRKS